MSWFVAYARSSIGAKQVMAISGLLLLLFAISHMIGHLVMFGGQEAYNDYAHFLQTLGHGAVKWVIRGGLLALLVVHVISGVRLAQMNRAARPVRYAVYRAVRTNPWARTMVWSGIIVLVFLTFHILHFTVGLVQPGFFHKKAAGINDAYGMYVHGFQNVGILATYLVGMTLLMFHLAHGASSVFQSLGLKHPKYDLLIEKGGPVLALVLYLGYIIPPIAVFIGAIKLPGV
jgi:succinate dehydrogenase / fumarate reductase cytochrome b subunit